MGGLGVQRLELVPLVSCRYLHDELGYDTDLWVWLRKRRPLLDSLRESFMLLEDRAARFPPPPLVLLLSMPLLSRSHWHLWSLSLATFDFGQVQF